MNIFVKTAMTYVSLSKLTEQNFNFFPPYYRWIDGGLCLAILPYSTMIKTRH